MRLKIWTGAGSGIATLKSGFQVHCSPVFCHLLRISHAILRRWCEQFMRRSTCFFYPALQSQPELVVPGPWPLASRRPAQNVFQLDFESIAEGPRKSRKQYARVSSPDHLPSTEDMIGTHGLPSCLFGFFTRRTLKGGKRMGFLTMMDATDCDFARRGRQIRVDVARLWYVAVLCRSRGPDRTSCEERLENGKVVGRMRARSGRRVEAGA